MKPSMRASVWAPACGVVLAALLGCTPSVAPAPAPAPEPAPAPQDRAPQTSEVEAAAAAAQPPEAHIGDLRLTKGSQGMVEGALLDADDLEERFGSQWRSLRGRRLRIQGTRRVHRCAPQEQCMIGGEIPYFDDVTTIEICRDDDTTAWPHLEVDCPVDQKAIDACLASCEAESDSCDSSASRDRGQLRRCGCARISCQQRCEAGGDPIFGCG